MKVPNSDLMIERGYSLYHTGGGCMAWEKAVEAGRIWITNEDAGIDGDPAEPIWIACRYLEDEHRDDIGWVFTDPSTTLPNALRIADSLEKPEPGQEEAV